MPWLNFLPRFNDLRKGYTKPENRRYKCDFHSCFHPDNSQLPDTMHRVLYKAQYIFQGRNQKGPGQGRPGSPNIFKIYKGEQKQKYRIYYYWLPQFFRASYGTAFVQYLRRGGKQVWLHLRTIYFCFI